MLDLTRDLAHKRRFFFFFPFVCNGAQVSWLAQAEACGFVCVAGFPKAYWEKKPKKKQLFVEILLGVETFQYQSCTKRKIGLNRCFSCWSTGKSSEGCCTFRNHLGAQFQKKKITYGRLTFVCVCVCI